MMKHFVYIPFLALNLLLTNCSAENHKDNLEEAETAYEIKEYNRAQIICEHILKNSEKQNISCHELCRLSLLYMGLAEVNQDSSSIYVANATDVLLRAYKISSDSVIDYFQTLEADELPNSQLVLNITGSMQIPIDSLLTDEGNEADVLYNQEYETK